MTTLHSGGAGDGKAGLAESSAKQQADIVAEQNAELLKSRRATTEWLQRTYLSERKAEDKERVLDKITEIIAAPVAPKQAS
jgi:hypothetical protein